LQDTLSPRLQRIGKCRLAREWTGRGRANRHRPTRKMSAMVSVVRPPTRITGTSDRQAQLERKLAVAYDNRGLAWGHNGDLERALANDTEAIRLLLPCHCALQTLPRRGAQRRSRPRHRRFRRSRPFRRIEGQPQTMAGRFPRSKSLAKKDERNYNSFRPPKNASLRFKFQEGVQAHKRERRHKRPSGVRTVCV
jgi:hypothetical protein